MNQASHWAESSSLGRRTSFRTQSVPNSLLVEELTLQVRVCALSFVDELLSDHSLGSIPIRLDQYALLLVLQNGLSYRKCHMGQKLFQLKNVSNNRNARGFIFLTSKYQLKVLRNNIKKTSTYVLTNLLFHYH